MNTQLFQHQYARLHKIASEAREYGRHNFRAEDMLMELMNEQCCRSWIGCKFEQDGTEYEVNTSYGYVAIGDFFAQGYNAEQIMQDIHYLYIINDITPEQAVIMWEQYNL